MTDPKQSESERHECWTCDGTGEQDSLSGGSIECLTCDGDGRISVETIRRMWYEYKYAESPDDTLRADGGTRAMPGPRGNPSIPCHGCGNEERFMAIKQSNEWSLEYVDGGPEWVAYCPRCADELEERLEDDGLRADGGPEQPDSDQNGGTRATRCPECEAVLERCCADCVRERCPDCGATIDWPDAEPVARGTLEAFGGGETA